MDCLYCYYGNNLKIIFYILYIIKMEILQNGFCMIPNVVLYDNELSDKQKLLYWVISSLCAEKWYCRASNEYIWELLDADKRTISRNISELYERWYIEVNIDSYNKRYIELNSVIKNNDSQNWLGGIDKNVYGDRQKYLHININNKNKENIINNNTEQSSEIQNQPSNQTWNQTNINSLSLVELKEKEKSSAKKEKEIKMITTEINDLISQIKEMCDVLKVAYNKDMERQFSKHILTAKDYWDFCEKIWQTRVEFALNVLKVSVWINYYRGALSWPKLIYKHYAELYNQAKQKSPKLQTPTIQVL